MSWQGIRTPQHTPLVDRFTPRFELGSEMAIVVTLLASSSALLSPSLPIPRCTSTRTPTPLLELKERTAAAAYHGCSDHQHAALAMLNPASSICSSSRRPRSSRRPILVLWRSRVAPPARGRRGVCGTAGLAPAGEQAPQHRRTGHTQVQVAGDPPPPLPPSSFSRRCCCTAGFSSCRARCLRRGNSRWPRRPCFLAAPLPRNSSSQLRPLLNLTTNDQSPVCASEPGVCALTPARATATALLFRLRRVPRRALPAKRAPSPSRWARGGV